MINLSHIKNKSLCKVFGHTDDKMRGFDLMGDYEYERCMRCYKEWRVE